MSDIGNSISGKKPAEPTSWRINVAVFDAHAPCGQGTNDVLRRRELLKIGNKYQAASRI